MRGLLLTLFLTCQFFQKFEYRLFNIALGDLNHASFVNTFTPWISAIQLESNLLVAKQLHWRRWRLWGLLKGLLGGGHEGRDSFFHFPCKDFFCRSGDRTADLPLSSPLLKLYCLTL